MSHRLPPRCLTLLASFGSAAALAAPVGGEGLGGEPDPFELAQRWTLASTVLLAPPVPAQPSPAAVPLRASAPGPVDNAVPDPVSYALMGLGLLGLGLAARQFGARRRDQRGFSKKT